jgi:hypothetical protein
MRNPAGEHYQGAFPGFNICAVGSTVPLGSAIGIHDAGGIVESVYTVGRDDIGFCGIEIVDRAPAGVGMHMTIMITTWLCDMAP